MPRKSQATFGNPSHGGHPIPCSIAKLKCYASQANETKNLKARPVCVVAITDDALNAQLPFGSKSGGQISKSGKWRVFRANFVILHDQYRAIAKIRVARQTNEKRPCVPPRRFRLSVSRNFCARIADDEFIC
jgi:hypothetical protein